jgi:hypothetical protein
MPPTIEPEQPKLSEGTCDFDPQVWTQHNQTSIANAIMFNRLSGISCTECLEACINDHQSPASPWICRSLTYDHRWKVCDLYAVTGDKAPHHTVMVPGRDYFILNRAALALTTPTPGGDGAATTTAAEGTTTAASATSATPPAGGPDATTTTAAPAETTTTTATPVNPCPDGRVPRYCKLTDKSLGGTGTTVAAATTEAACQAACDRSEGLNGDKCASFTLTGTECKLYTDALTISSTNAQDAAGSNLYQQVCLPEGTPEGIWNMALGKILVGYVQSVETATTVEECKEKCLAANFGCKSGMFYPEDPTANCLLNSETSASQPGVYINEDPAIPMAYFDQGSSARRVLRDDPIEAGITSSRWTQWNDCTQADTFAFRYMKCKEKDIRNCPKQTRRCNSSAAVHAISPCRAVVDTKGQKHCPHGVRKMSNGQTKYCNTPIDCPRS